MKISANLHASHENKLLLQLLGIVNWTEPDHRLKWICRTFNSEDNLQTWRKYSLMKSIMAGRLRQDNLLGSGSPFGLLLEDYEYYPQPLSWGDILGYRLYNEYDWRDVHEFINIIERHPLRDEDAVNLFAALCWQRDLSEVLGRARTSQTPSELEAMLPQNLISFIDGNSTYTPEILRYLTDIYDLLYAKRIENSDFQVAMNAALPRIFFHSFINSRSLVSSFHMQSLPLYALPFSVLEQTVVLFREANLHAAGMEWLSLFVPRNMWNNLAKT